ncbi:MAG: hypothetical protein ONB37_07925 [candidate division KSB1 bacterium]|nr:hypothetical protein [candidate division KSB1 bacterium]
MRKRHLLLFIVWLLSIATTISAQIPQILTKSWSDGQPTFRNISQSNNVRVDSVVSLIPTLGFSEEPPGFELMLSAFDSNWTWPQEPADKVKIVGAAAIELYLDLNNVIHYVVADREGGKIIDLILPRPDRAWVLDAIDGDRLNNPASIQVYKENGNPVFLIAEEGRHRVIKYDRIGDVVKWKFGAPASNELFSPLDAVVIPGTDQVLICDTGNHRLVLVDGAGTIINTFGSGILNRPVDIDYNPTSQEVLITDQNNNRVLKLDIRTNVVTWDYDIGLNLPSDADFLPNGDVLICDRGNNRMIEVNLNRQIVWQLETPIQNLKDADRLGIDLGQEWVNKHLAIVNGQPALIGYLSHEFYSAPRYLNRAVSFDQLFWTAKTEHNTSIQLQFRTGNSPEQLMSPNNPWRGPSELEAYYTTSGSEINPIHDGDAIYQFKAILSTSDPLYTPVLNNVKVTYRYYDTEVTGQLTSGVVRDSSNYIITKWKSLKYHTILPPNPINRDKVRIEVTLQDGISGAPLRTFVANPFNSVNEEPLDNIAALRLKQNFRIHATLNTNTTAATPILDSWELIWESTPLTKANIDFVKLINQEFRPTSYYRVPISGQDYIDYVNVRLVDPNLVPIQSAITLRISSLQTRDSEQVTLSLRPEGWYLMDTSIPAAIADTVKINDRILQVQDRDRLVVTYIDPMNPSDQASDTALIVQNTEGIVQFLIRDVEGLIKIRDDYYTKIDSAAIGDTIFVYFTGERDRDLSSDQDKFSIVVFDFETADKETLNVLEIPDSLSRYQTGNFLSEGLPLVLGRTPIFSDGLLQTFAGSRISLTYEETISKIPIIKVYDKHPPIPIEPYAGLRSLDFDIAPNPYYEDRHNLLRIRVASSVGDLIVEKIEIFNFAGQKITEIAGSSLKFYYAYPIPAEQFSYADNWWDLRDQNSVPISSGTYWVKVSGNTVNSNRSFSHIKKLVIVR